MTKNELLNIIAEVKETCPFEYIGVRTQEASFQLGDISHFSSVWVDGYETEEKLDGISCTDVDSPAISAHCDEISLSYGNYYGDHVAILASESAEDGVDIGELVMHNAIVVRIIK